MRSCPVDPKRRSAMIIGQYQNPGSAPAFDAAPPNPSPICKPAREPEPVLDLQDPPLHVRRDIRDPLILELRRAPAGNEAVAVRVAGLHARHQIDRHVDAHDDTIEEAVVELQGPLERMLDEQVVRRAQEPVPVVEDETEAHVPMPEDVGPVHREEPLGVHRGPEQMGVQSGAIAGGDRVRRLGPRVAGGERQSRRSTEREDGRPKAETRRDDGPLLRATARSLPLLHHSCACPGPARVPQCSCPLPNRTRDSASLTLTLT